MDLPDFSRLHDEGHAASKALGDQVVVNCSGSKQGPDRNPVDADPAVRQDQELVLLGGLLGLLANPVDGLLQIASLAERIGDIDHLWGKVKEIFVKKNHCSVSHIKSSQ